MVSLCIHVKAKYCVFNNTLTGLSRYARLVPCMINRGSRVMDRAWWRVSTDAMVWSNLPARPPSVTMASTWKDKQNFRSRGLIYWPGLILVFVSMKKSDRRSGCRKQRQRKIAFYLHLDPKNTHCGRQLCYLAYAGPILCEENKSSKKYVSINC